MPRLVRRQSVWSRVLASINPFDYLLTVATDIEAYDWDALQTVVGTPLGFALNLLCLLARYNAGSKPAGYDDVFARPPGRAASWSSPTSNWMNMLAYMLLAFSAGNMVYCFTKKRRYRLFESNIDIPPATPSARIVPIHDAPDSPLPFVATVAQVVLRPWLVLSPSYWLSTTASPSHPDAATDVWELAIWDPTPLSQRLFALFSPAHVAVYFLSFPLVTTTYGYHNPAPTTPGSFLGTVIAIQVLMSVQMLYVQHAFGQQQKDIGIRNRQVLHEYDTKYVHPRLNSIRRDVSVQCDASTSSTDRVEVFTPQFNRLGFRTASSTAVYDRPYRPSSSSPSITASSTVPRSYMGSATTTTNPNTGPSAFRPFVPRSQTDFKIRQPNFAAAASSTSTSTSNSARPRSYRPRQRSSLGGTVTTPPLAESDLDTEEDADEEIMRAAPKPPTTPGRTPGRGREGYVYNRGMTGLVNLAKQNSANLTPSKGTPRRGLDGRYFTPSSYAENIGLGGTPRRHM